jgi:uncharacterized membrane protein
MTPLRIALTTLGVRTKPIPLAPLSSSHNNIEAEDIPIVDPLDLASSTSPANPKQSKNSQISTLWIGTAALALYTPAAALAASSGDAVPSAMAAYVHYLSLLLITASVMTERLTVKHNMSIEEEKLLGYADIMTGAAGTALAVSGYYRATQYGKGWDFYAHEPIFWLKMTFLGIFGGLSFPPLPLFSRPSKFNKRERSNPCWKR